MESLRQQLSELDHQQDELSCLDTVRTLIANRMARLVLGYLLNSPYAFGSERLTLSSYAELLHTILDSGVISKDLCLNLMRIQDACDARRMSSGIDAPEELIFPSLTTRLSCSHQKGGPRRADFLTCVADTLRELDLKVSALLVMFKQDGHPWAPRVGQKH